MLLLPLEVAPSFIVALQWIVTAPPWHCSADKHDFMTTVSKQRNITDKFWERWRCFLGYFLNAKLNGRLLTQIFKKVNWLTAVKERRLKVFFTLSCSHCLTKQFNKLQLTDSSVHSPLLFLCSLTFLLPFRNRWYIEIYEPIILLIKLPCPRYIYFPPNLLFPCQCSFSPTLGISLFVPWLTPVNISPPHRAERN